MHATACGCVEPAVVQQNSRGCPLFEDNIRLVPYALALRILQGLDDVRARAPRNDDLSPGAVLVDEFLHRGPIPLSGSIFDHERSAVLIEGHTSGCYDSGRLGDDLDLDPFRDAVALEPRV